MFLAQHYHASAMLFALLLGMALNFLSQEGRCVAGIQVSATSVLRIGVALLGLRISVGQVVELGALTAAVIAASVFLTLALGVVLARICALDTRFGILTGGAVAICGASAALAIASVLPRHANSDRDTSFAVIGVTALSTIAMIGYPVIVAWLGLGQRDSGIFLGGTIHDVAQVVGAGYGMSKEAGDTATIVKLLRVAMLLPALLLISLVTRPRDGVATAGAPLLPWFGVAFFGFVVLNSAGWVPQAAALFAAELSRWCLVTAIAAIGMKTSLKELSAVGVRPVALMVLQTVVLAALVAALLSLR